MTGYRARTIDARILRDGWAYARFLSGLRGFLRERMTLERARGIVRARLETRADNFLHLLERSVYQNPRSPYRTLLEWADCGLEDIRRMLRTEGLEATLRALRESGVYVTFEEFKGRAPIVREGRELPIRPGDFDNPHLSRTFGRASGGSTGASRHVRIDLDHLRALVPMTMIADWAHGLLGTPAVNWFDTLPGPGLQINLIAHQYDDVPERWFSPLSRPGQRQAWRFRATEWGILAIGRAMGARLPLPESADLGDADILARWAEETLREHGRCRIITMVSRALRIALAAEELGIDLAGMTFSAGGEPPTRAKLEAIERTGARFVSSYYFAEAGAAALACANPADINDLHLLRDQLALIQYPRNVPGVEATVDSFHFTSLLPKAPKVLLNAESDDYGIVEDRSCGCPLDELGLDVHIRWIRSFRKLTGEGVTLIGTDMIHILENVLPSRFGGSALDYQLLEEEDERGFTRLSIIVSPRVELADEREVVRAVLDELGRGDAAANISRSIWTQAETLRVRRMEPVWTERGKLLPLHIARLTTSRRSAGA